MDLQQASAKPDDRQGAPSRRRLVVYGNPVKRGLSEALASLTGWSARHGAVLHVAHDLVPLLGAAAGVPIQVFHDGAPGALNLPDGAPTLLICLGGDGTLIHAMRRFHPLDAPVLSVNLGSLGFNASVEPEQLLPALDAWAADEAQISERMTLRARWLRDGQILAESTALNDVVLLKQTAARMIYLSLRQGEALISSYAADGLIVSTPTGSTAYNLSAGGPIVYPTMRAMVATAICPHTLASRAVVLPPSPPVILEYSNRHSGAEASLWVDGQDRWSVAEGDRIAVEANPEPLRLISGGAAQYFEKLHRKLCWSGEIPYLDPERQGP